MNQGAILAEVLASKKASGTEAHSAFEHLIRDTGAPPAFLIRRYQPGYTLVDQGRAVDTSLSTTPGFGYATVPLGLILDGSLTVYERGVGVRQLCVGDCIGVFETAHWLTSGTSRQIGEWTLVADSALSVLFVGEDALGEEAAFRDFVLMLARKDTVPQPVTSLPLLDWTAAHTTKHLLQDTAIVFHSHILPTNASLVRHLAHLVGIDRMFILEKPYSTITTAYEELVRMGVDVTPVHVQRGVSYHDALERSIAVLWRKVVEGYGKQTFTKLLLLDDGGDLWATVPWSQMKGVRISGVEQTQRGVSRFANSTLTLPPIVSVASSGVKKIVESKFIGSAIVEKLAAANRLTSRVGIIGMGSIGVAIFDALASLGVKALCYDPKQPQGIPAGQFRASIDVLLRECDLIIGATGTDTLRGVTLDAVVGHKTFASASSVDIEFGVLVRLAKGQSSFDDITVTVHEGLTCTVLNAGFPVNFDRAREWEAPADIAVTRSLLYIGTMQAVQLLESRTPSGFFALDVTAQELLLRKWLEARPAMREADIAKIAQTVFLENARQMQTVWF